MRTARIAVVSALLLVIGGTPLAQTLPLPKELSGRWTFVKANRTQTFTLDDMAASGPSGFTARLTWWTSDPQCTIRGEPLVGRVTATGIAFDAKTKCDVSFTVELNRADDRWTGKAVTTSGPRVELELKAS
mgnify:CR=1 FL=1